MAEFISENKEVRIGYLIAKGLKNIKRLKIAFLRFFDNGKVILVVDIKKIKNASYQNNFLFTCYVIQNSKAEIVTYTESHLLEMEEDLDFVPDFLARLFPTVTFPDLT